ncbi:AAA family ATPase [Reichenbachiella sp.]|uniref:AAA family ATPase n=1 Tax=Reichenbachiella sp. TaxID=2184521 RepID=UPI0032984812
MIVRFIVSNFKSFKEPVEFSFIAGNYKRHDNHVVSVANMNLLRCSALYGNNGSGKTNFLLAIEFLHDLVMYEYDSEFPHNIPTFKLDPTFAKEPTQFEIEYIVDNIRYSYSITFKNNIIIEEWLYKMKEGNDYDIIFERKFDGGSRKIKLGSKKKLTRKEKYRREIYAEDLKNEEVFFNTGANKELKEFEHPYSWFSQKLNIVGLNAEFNGLPYHFGTNEKFAKLANQLICETDLGIEEIDVVKTPIDEFFGPSDTVRKDDIIKRLENFDGIDITANKEEYSVYKDDDGEIIVVKIVTFRRNKAGRLISFNLKEESAGTRRLFNLIPALINAITNNGVYIVDELESSFHPVLIKGILKMYLNLSGNYKGQILFSTHESHLLDLELLRQDEIWFAEKCSDGSTKLTSISDFKPRFDKDIRKGYLEGQFSRIPFVGRLEDLNWN